MIIIADSNIFMSALISPTGLVASILSTWKMVSLKKATGISLFQKKKWLPIPTRKNLRNNLLPRKVIFLFLDLLRKPLSDYPYKEPLPNTIKQLQQRQHFLLKKENNRRIGWKSPIYHKQVWYTLH